MWNAETAYQAFTLKRYYARAAGDEYLLFPSPHDAGILLGCEAAAAGELRYCLAWTDGPGAILAAIECENKDADQGLALCDRVADYYPEHVYTGVVADKYYIDAEILKAVQAQAKEAPGPEQPDEAEASEVFLGAFWMEESGCGELLHAVQQMQARHERIGTLTVAALHQTQANALAGALLSAAGGSLPAARILLYAFAEQTFAPYTADQ